MAEDSNILLTLVLAKGLADIIQAGIASYQTEHDITDEQVAEAVAEAASAHNTLQNTP